MNQGVFWDFWSNNMTKEPLAGPSRGRHPPITLKIRLSSVMTATDQDLAAMVQTLEQSGEYRVLRRLPFRQQFSTPTELTKVGILFDVETTGLDTASDEVVELGMSNFPIIPTIPLAQCSIRLVLSMSRAERSLKKPSSFTALPTKWQPAIKSMAMPSPLSFPMQLLSSPITRPLTANLPKGTGRCLRVSPGPAR